MAKAQMEWEKIVAVALGLLVLVALFVFAMQSTALGGILPGFANIFTKNSGKDGCDQSFPELRKARDDAFKGQFLDKIQSTCALLNKCYPDKYEEFKPSCECNAESYYASLFSNKDAWIVRTDYMLINYLEKCVPIATKNERILQLTQQIDWMCYGTYAPSGRVSELFKIQCEYYLLTVANGIYTKANAETDLEKRKQLFNDAQLAFMLVWEDYPTNVNAWWGYVYSYPEADWFGYGNAAGSVESHAKDIGRENADLMLVYLADKYFNKNGYTDWMPTALDLTHYMQDISLRQTSITAPLTEAQKSASIILGNRYIYSSKNYPSAETLFYSVFRRHPTNTGAVSGLLKLVEIYTQQKTTPPQLTGPQKAQRVLEDMLIVYKNNNMPAEFSLSCSRIKNINPSYSNSECPVQIELTDCEKAFHICVPEVQGCGPGEVALTQYTCGLSEICCGLG